MFKYIQKLFRHFFILLVLLVIAIINWRWPLYLWLGDTAAYRFIWLAVFFVVLDIFIEIILYSVHEVQVIGETMSFSKEIHKLSDGFRVVSNISLPNNIKADYMVVGSSGVWLVDVKDEGGNIIFDGDELVQDDKILKGLLIHILEKSFSLANLLKKDFNRDIKVSSVIAFTSLKANLSLVPKSVRGVFISSRKDITGLIENTDVQLIDKNTSEEIFKKFSKK